MKFILIFIAIQTQFASYSATAEFDDEPACEVALRALRQTQRYTVKVRPHSAVILAECFQKGSAK